MPEAATMATTRSVSTDGGFWGSVSSGVGSALGEVVGKILPAWTAKQLKVELPGAAISNPAVVNMGNNPSLGNQANQLQAPGKADETIFGMPQYFVLGAGAVLLFILLKRL